MMLNPILASSALRRMRSMRTLLLVGAYVTVLLLLFCACTSTFLTRKTYTADSMDQGILAYLVLMVAQFMLMILIAPAMTASSIAGERERQTLELLLVTNTGSFSIVFGKLLESFAFLALLIFSSLPVLCLTMILGGIGLAEILTGLLFLIVCAFAAASVGVLCSSFMKSTLGATIVSYLALLFIGVSTIMPLITSIDTQRITDVLYNNVSYAALTQGDALKMLPAPLYINPGVGLICLLEEQTALLQSTVASGWGRLYAMFLMLRKISFSAMVLINMGVMLLLSLGMMLIAALLVRPRRVRIGRRKA